jgi:hypothetical protein
VTNACRVLPSARPVTLLAVVVLIPGMLGNAQGATAAAAATAPAPGAYAAPAAAPAAIRAFTGVWGSISSERGVVPKKESIPLKPEYEVRRADLERRLGKEVIEGRNSKCIPDGMPDMMAMSFRLEANAEYMTMIGGNGPAIRLIWLNRNEHKPERLLFPSYGGDAIARWDGDTLIVDTIGLNSGNELSYGLAADDEHLHIVERWRLLSPTRLEVVTSIESPAALTKPWVYKSLFGRRDLSGDIVYCDRPVINYNTLDLTPPKGGYIPPGATE